MKDFQFPSRHQLLCNYAYINRRVFGGRLRRDVKFLDWRQAHARSSNARRGDLGGSNCDAGWIWINRSKNRSVRCWSLTLLHEMMHFHFGLGTPCTTYKFRRAMFRAILRLRWNLL